jgi:adenine-specific DNA methylase
MFVQKPLFPIEQIRPYSAPFPSTRYQGSKRKLTEWIWANVENLEFDTVLDVFGGTGAVSHLFKTASKQVIYNDNLTFNWNIGLALIQNQDVTMFPEDITVVLETHPDVEYPDFIQKTFAGIYFTDEENAWLDRIVFNIDHFLNHPIKQALARFALFQACIIKRPYNLFHRANLYMRLANVKRSFGNKATWDTPFETHWLSFVQEANAAVFNNHRDNTALNLNALETPTGSDLVYIDPPYINKKGTGVNYLDFYHFLEGLARYEEWPDLIDYQSKHKRFAREVSDWDRLGKIRAAFEALVQRHRNSILVVSYRDDGIPSKAELIGVLKKYKQDVREAQKNQKYALALQDSKELLLIAT